MTKRLERLDNFNNQLGNNYGPIPSGFEFDLLKGYSVLAGKNDCGKSALLQFVFRFIFPKREKLKNDFCLISQDRQYILPTTKPDLTLSGYNAELIGCCSSRPRLSHTLEGPNTGSLYVALLHRTDFIKQMEKINEYLARLGFEPISLQGQQEVKINDVNVHCHGSGLRCVIPILAALTSPDINFIIIDEPELSLEAGAQKVLKELLIENADEGKDIIIATQSHLFLDKVEPRRNYVVVNDNCEFKIKRLRDEKEIIDLTYNLLGNSLEDLFFPSNFLIVEGVSDQIICEKIAYLLKAPSGKIKIISARGVDNVSDSYKAIENTLVPLVAGYSPYSKKIVVLLDKPKTKHQEKVKKIKDCLGNRCIILTHDSIEDYIPEEIYKKAERNKQEDIDEIKRIKEEIRSKGKGFKELFNIKKEISNDIANVIGFEDLKLLPKIRKSVEIAIKKAG